MLFLSMSPNPVESGNHLLNHSWLKIIPIKLSKVASNFEYFGWNHIIKYRILSSYHFDGAKIFICASFLGIFFFWQLAQLLFKPRHNAS